MRFQHRQDLFHVFRSFSPIDLQTLNALEQSPDAVGWTFHLSRDETQDVISVQPPYAQEALFFIVPAETGQGVLMTTEAAEEVACPSLSDALLSVGPRGADWRRCIG
jgi:hypothetical protein